MLINRFGIIIEKFIYDSLLWFKFITYIKNAFYQNKINSVKVS
jgi:hypothetical protein